MLIAIGAFFIPGGEGFETAWMVIGMIGGFVFILIQLILIVDFAHAWNEKWLGKFEESQSKWWFAGESVFFFHMIVSLNTDACHIKIIYSSRHLPWCEIRNMGPFIKS